MSSVGAELRELREARALTQAEVAEAVGTTQQTVARIERGETTHSRYIPKIRAHLASVPGPGLEPLPPSSFVSTYSLDREGQLSKTDIKTVVPFTDPTGQVFALQLQRGVVGPVGDPMFRAGAVLIIDPGAVPHHYDWCLKRLEDGRAQMMLFVDRAQMPKELKTEQLVEWGYGVGSSDNDRSYQKVIAHYMG